MPADVEPMPRRNPNALELTPEQEDRRVKILLEARAAKRRSGGMSKIPTTSKWAHRDVLPCADDPVPAEVLGSRPHVEPEKDPGPRREPSEGLRQVERRTYTTGGRSGSKRALVREAAREVHAKGLPTSVENVLAQLGDRWTDGPRYLAVTLNQCRHRGEVPKLPEGYKARKGGRPPARDLGTAVPKNGAPETPALNMQAMARAVEADHEREMCEFAAAVAGRPRAEATLTALVARPGPRVKAEPVSDRKPGQRSLYDEMVPLAPVREPMAEATAAMSILAELEGLPTARARIRVLEQVDELLRGRGLL